MNLEAPLPRRPGRPRKHPLPAPSPSLPVAVASAGTQKLQPFPIAATHPPSAWDTVMAKSPRKYEMKKDPYSGSGSGSGSKEAVPHTSGKNEASLKLLHDSTVPIFVPQKQSHEEKEQKVLNSFAGKKESISEKRKASMNTNTTEDDEAEDTSKKVGHSKHTKVAKAKKPTVKKITSDDSDSGVESTISMMHSSGDEKSSSESSSSSSSSSSESESHLSDKNTQRKPKKKPLSFDERHKLKKEREARKARRDAVKIIKQLAKEARDKPNEYVSYIKPLEGQENGADEVFERISFPEVRLRVDHLHSDHWKNSGKEAVKEKLMLTKKTITVEPSEEGGKLKKVRLPDTKGCHYCFLLYKVFAGWYEKNFANLNLVVDTEFKPQEGVIDDPRLHTHEITVDGEILELPELMIDFKRALKKAKKISSGDTVKRKTRVENPEEASQGTEVRSSSRTASRTRNTNDNDDGDDEMGDDDEDEEEANDEESVAESTGSRRQKRKANTKKGSIVDSQVQERPVRNRQSTKLYTPTEIPLSNRSAAESLGSGAKRGRKRKLEEFETEEEDEEFDELQIPVTAVHVNEWIKELHAFLKTEFQTEKMYGKLRDDRYTFVPHEHQEALYQHFKAFDWKKRETSAARRNFWLFWEAGAGKTDGPQYLIMKNPPEHFVSIMDKTVLEQTISHTEIFPQLQGRTKFTFLTWPQFKAIVSKPAQKRIKKKEIKYSVLNEPLARALLENSVTQVDEVHRFRSLLPTQLAEIEALVRFPNVKFNLSGTPLMNQLCDIFYIRTFNESIPIVSMTDIFAVDKDTGKKLWPNIKLPKVRSDYEDIIKEMYQNCFWFIPEEEKRLPSVQIDTEVVLGWTQCLKYVLNSCANPKIGNLIFGGPKGNSFDSRTRPIANCLVDEVTKRFISSPKFEKLEEYMEECFNAPNRSRLSVLICSRFCDPAGIETLYEWLKSRPIWKKATIELMTGKTKEEEREAKRLRLISGETDFLLSSPIAAQSFDCPDCAGVVALEVCNSIGEEKQQKGRTDRTGAKILRPDLVLHYKRLIAVFPTFRNPTARPNKKEEAELWEWFCKYAKRSKESLMNTDPGPDLKNPKECYGIDIVRDLIVELKRLGITSDQKRQIRNPVKFQLLQNLISCFKGASIKFKDTNVKFKADLHAMLNNLDKQKEEMKPFQVLLDEDEDAIPNKQKRDHNTSIVTTEDSASESDFDDEREFDMAD